MEDTSGDEKHLAHLIGRRKEIQQLRSRAYEEKLLGKIDEKFWIERCAAWQRELDEIDQEVERLEKVPSKADLIAAARQPLELLQAAPTLYVSQEPREKGRLLKPMVSNFTVDDESVFVAMRSPFDLLARARRLKIGGAY